MVDSFLVLGLRIVLGLCSLDGAWCKRKFVKLVFYFIVQGLCVFSDALYSYSWCKCLPEWFLFR